MYEPVNRDNVLEGAKLAFGQPVETHYDLSKADVILSLDADFLYAGFPGFTRYARDFAKRRNPDAGEMSRLYVAESTPSSTGAKADHRLPVRAVEIESFVRALDMMLGDDTDNEHGPRGPAEVPGGCGEGPAKPSWLQRGCCWRSSTRRSCTRLVHRINQPWAMSARRFSIPIRSTPTR